MLTYRFTALVDACSLANVLGRNALLSLAEAGLFRVRWSRAILDETERALCGMFEKRGDLAEEARAKSRRAVAAMERAFEPATVEPVSPALVESLAAELPDPDDAHVVAAAITCQASTIVTENIRDFPAEVLDRFSIGVLSTDRFLADTIDLDHAAAGDAISGMRARLQRPELTRDELLLRFEKNGFIEAAGLLRTVPGLLR